MVGWRPGRLAAQAKKVQPAFQSARTECRLQDNTNEWLQNGLTIMEEHYQGALRRAGKEIIASPGIDWKEAWQVAVKWTQIRYKRMKEQTVRRAWNVVKTLMSRRRSEVEAEEGTSVGPDAEARPESPQEPEQGQREQEEQGEAVPMEVDQSQRPASPAAPTAEAEGEGAERSLWLRRRFQRQRKEKTEGSPQVIEVEEGALDWLFSGEVSEDQEGPAKEKAPQEKADVGDKERPSKPPGLETPRWSIHVNHESKEKARNWSLAPVNPVLFVGASNLSRLPRTEAWEIEVHSFPGATIVDGYNIIKHRTRTIGGTEHVVLAFGLNDRANSNITALGKMLEKLVEAAKATFPGAKIYVPLINFDKLGNFVEELDVLLSSFPEDGTPLLVFGDFNIHLEKPHATDFISLLASFDLKRLITTGTHKSGNQLDLVYTRNCITDNILGDKENVQGWGAFRTGLGTTALDNICPFSSRPARATPSNPWLSEVLREHQTELRAAERKWRKSKDTYDLSMYKSLLSSFSVDVHAAKSSYFHNKINSSSNTRSLFKTFNSLLCPPPPQPTSSLTADDFANFLTNKRTTISSQFSAPHTQEPRLTPSTANNPLSSFSPLTEEEVSTLLLSSHPTTCPLDPIPSHLLQAISPTLLPALTHIINSSLHTGTFPTAFKQARVTPLLKKPTLNTSFVENYRPVSLLPFIAKTLERAVFNQLTSFLSLNNQLDVNQSGFKKGHSTETALLSVTEALRIAKAASKSSVLILLDLSAAFDTVNHQILMSSLSSLGITGTSLHWFESYLTGRSFRVAWRSEVSKHIQPLTTGVPQGSVLRPLLFSIYTTSLGHIIQAHGFSYHCYADDTQLFLSFQPDDPTVAARVSSCLADISAWMKEHHLQLNLAKTELLVLPANPSLQHDFTIQLESSSITPSRSVRNLGVTFDDQLTFTDHISKTAR
ncbi:hypothetical protein PO909_000002 [Leuciscus waleckii]